MNRRTKRMIPATTKMSVCPQYANIQTHKMSIIMTIREPKILSPGNMTHITDTTKTKMDIVNRTRLAPNHPNCNKVNTRDHPQYTNTDAINGISHLVMTTMNKINSQKMEMNPIITMDIPTLMVGTGLAESLNLA